MLEVAIKPSPGKSRQRDAGVVSEKLTLSVIFGWIGLRVLSKASERLKVREHFTMQAGIWGVSFLAIGLSALPFRKTFPPPIEWRIMGISAALAAALLALEARRWRQRATLVRVADRVAIFRGRRLISTVPRRWFAEQKHLDGIPAFAQ